MKQILKLEDAQQILLDHIAEENGIEEIPIKEAVGRILAEDAKAVYDQPPFPRSPLDGYAVRGDDTKQASSETPVTLRVIGKVYAGSVFEGNVHRGEAVRIMTGAPVPNGADTVIRQEDTDYGTEQVQIFRGSKAYQNYCKQGEDYKAGDVLLSKGCVLHAAEISILSSIGKPTVCVRKQPSIAVISSGDEVILPGAPLVPGKIYDSNQHYVRARLQELGITPSYVKHVEDDPESMANAIREAAKISSLIITTGGVSVGEKDILHETETILGAKHLFWRIHVKPGAPTLAFQYENTLVISLCGNPYGAIVNMDLLIRPVLAKLSGNPRLLPQKRQVRITDSYHKPAGARRFLRGFFNGETVSLNNRSQLAGSIASMAGCNCFVETPVDAAGLQEGDLVWIYLY